MSKLRTFNDDKVQELEKRGYKFQGATSNGLAFAKYVGGQIHKVLLQTSGRVRKYMPHPPQNRFERQKWGLKG